MVLLYPRGRFGAVFSLVDSYEIVHCECVNITKSKEIVNKILRVFLLNMLFAFLALVVAFLD